MRGLLFPRRLDNEFRGRRAGLWLLVPVVLVKLAMGLNSLLNPRVVASRADGIPLDGFGGGGAEAVVAFFALWGLGQAILASIGVLAWVRYRAMIPLVYLVFLLEHLGRRAVFLVHPIARTGAPAGGDGFSAAAWVAYALLAATTLGFALSLMGRPGLPEAGQPG